METKNYKVRFQLHNIKTVHISMILLTVLFLLISIGCIYELCSPVYARLSRLDTVEITVQDANYIPKRRLYLTTASEKYRCDIARGAVKQFKDAMKQYPLEGETLTAMIATSKNVFGFDRERIVDLRSEKTVYYDIAAEKKDMKRGHDTLFIVGPLVWIVTAFLIFLFIWDIKQKKIIVIQKKKRKNIPRK